MMYMNTETGEVLTRKEMLAQFREEYDGGDPTNIISVEDIYTEVGSYLCPACQKTQMKVTEFVDKGNGLCQCVYCGNWANMRRVS